MKLFVKEMFYKLLMFIVLCLLWCFLLKINIFDAGIFGFVVFIITYILVEIIYKVLKKKTKILTNKITKYVATAISVIIFSGIAMAVIDYDLAVNGEEPVFTWKEELVEDTFRIYSEDGSIREEERVAVIKHKGFGYNLIVFNKNVISEKKVMLFPLGIGTYSYQWPIEVNEVDITQ